MGLCMSSPALSRVVQVSRFRFAINASGSSVTVACAARTAGAEGICVFAAAGSSGLPLNRTADICLDAGARQRAYRELDLHIELIYFPIDRVEHSYRLMIGHFQTQSYRCVTHHLSESGASILDCCDLLRLEINSDLATE